MNKYILMIGLLACAILASSTRGQSAGNPTETPSTISPNAQAFLKSADWTKTPIQDIPAFRTGFAAHMAVLQDAAQRKFSPKLERKRIAGVNVLVGEVWAGSPPGCQHPGGPRPAGPLHADQDRLVGEVVPDIRERYAKRHLHLVDVDRRWRVSTNQPERGQRRENLRPND